MGEARTTAGTASVCAAAVLCALPADWVPGQLRWALVALGGALGAALLTARPATASLKVDDRPHDGSWFAPAQRGPGAHRLAAKLAAAGEPGSARRQLAVAVTGTGAGAVGGLAVAGVVGAVVGVAAALGLWWARLTAMAARRRRRFDEQLPEVLQMLSSSLRAGHGLAASLESVAAEAAAPAHDELSRAVAEVRLGKDVVEALGEVAQRCGSDDLGWVVDAMAVQRDLGGELAPLVDNVAATVRDRQSVRRQVRALSAEGRLSAAVLFVIPLALVVVLQVMNPGYLATLTGSGVGRVMLAGGAGLMVVGALWMRAIVKVRF